MRGGWLTEQDAIIAECDDIHHEAIGQEYLEELC